MKNRLRFITAASLFDGHDVSVNIMRRLLQSKGVEVIHLGHNRSAQEVVDAALMEDVQALALSSYQGGHNEYFAYIRELLDKAGANHINIFGGGGGVITAKEIKALEAKGITKIYSPEDGTKLGLVGIIDDMIAKSDFSTIEKFTPPKNIKDLDNYTLAKMITYIEEKGDESPVSTKEIPVFGITGTGGAGKSSLIDEILLRFNRFAPQFKIALVSIDPSKKKNQGALLGDRIRLGSAVYSQFFVRSLATRSSGTELSPHLKKVINFLKGQSFNLIMIETSGIGQASDAITSVADKFLYVMTPEFGAQTQLEKIEMLESAHFIAVNKFEKPRAEDALRDVRKQYRRNHNQFLGHPGAPTDNELPIFGTMASRFNDSGVNALFVEIVHKLKLPVDIGSSLIQEKCSQSKQYIIPPGRTNYLQEISETSKIYKKKNLEVVQKLRKWESLQAIINDSPELKSTLGESEDSLKKEIGQNVFDEISAFDKTVENYKSGEFSYKVRDKEVKVKTKYESLAHSMISKIGVPHFYYPSDKLNFIRNENLPGLFPYSGGIFPFKRQDEEPKRQFAGEGGPSRTNKRFHYLSANDTSKRLSTAFDSVTLYGEDPDIRPDIYGKIGESGVSIATLDDMKDLYAGFDLTSPTTSVSKTINGPAPIILAMFMNTAISQKLTGADFSNLEKRLEIMKNVRGTVQADILKEDQAQNTCIFSLDFAIKMMGDIQEYFCKNKIKNYYTVSISGYHIAEAGANPITQLALTLSNGFTYVEYYLSRGLHIDDFCENLSFFFSNGLDSEYTVMGRVARKIWAVTMRDKYGANPKSQKLKYHIQTSGRSLHAQEIDFNDIRTTLQAFLAFSDNCNSLHTNAYDEAITTPTEESVRRAMAIQLIINREFGLNKTDNPLQGSFIVDELTEIVESAVLKEFEKISERGGVLGAMESMYQRSKIQEESMHYEGLKDSGELPIIGVNTFLAANKKDHVPVEITMTRAASAEKDEQIARLNRFKKKNEDKSSQALQKLRQVASEGGNIFEELLETVQTCSLGQITSILYEVGGRYRRNM